MRVGIVVALVAAVAVTSCRKNANGDVEVKTPVVETRTDTVKMPSVEVTRDTVTAVTPRVEVKKETTAVSVPHVTVKRKP